jgi:hypothetical protein
VAASLCAVVAIAQPWGFREFTVLDPCGNAIVFGQWLG